MGILKSSPSVFVSVSVILPFEVRDILSLIQFHLVAMSSAVPNVLILGHTFVKRLQSDLKATFDAQADSNFHLDGTATVHLFGVGGRTVGNLRHYDLHVVRRLAPDVVILEVSTHDLSCA